MITRVLAIVCGLLCAVAICFRHPANAQPQDATLAIVDGTLIDGTGSAPLAHSVILVKNKRIIAVGSTKEMAIPDGVKIVRASGRFITPGLINSNVHLTMNGLADNRHWTRIAKQFEQYAAEYARISLLNGLTTVRDTWGPTDALIALREKINRGEVIGPRLVTSGPIVQHRAPLRRIEAHEQADMDPAVQEHVWAQMECNVAGPVEDGRRRLRALIGKGIDFVKFSATGDDYGDQPVLPQQTLNMIVEEAHRAGMTAESHTMEAEGLRMALLAGADAMQHPEVMTKPIPDDVLELMLKRKAVAVPIVVALHRHTLELDDPLVLATLPAALRSDYHRFVANAGKAPERQRKTIEQFRKYFEVSIANLRRMIAAGVVIAMGTDAGTTKNFHEAANHFEELEWYVKLGMTPMAALQTATLNGARLLRRDDLGVIRPGKVADILIVNGNPLEDIGAMRRLVAVIREGEVVLDQVVSEARRGGHPRSTSRSPN